MKKDDPETRATLIYERLGRFTDSRSMLRVLMALEQAGGEGMTTKELQRWEKEPSQVSRAYSTLSALGLIRRPEVGGRALITPGGAAVAGKLLEAARMAATALRRSVDV